MSGSSAFRGSTVPAGPRGIPWQDQVPRREAFEKAHPEVTITFLGPVWQAVIPGGEAALTEFELRDLLDVLEGRFAAGDSRPSAHPPGGGPGLAAGQEGPG